MKPSIENHLPLTQVAFEILLALVGGERHGYAILSDVRERSGGRLSLHPGTLYRAVSRLVEAGLIEEAEERPDPEMDDQRRRYYRLTSLGRRVAEAETARLAAQVTVARRLLGGGEAGS